MKRITDAELLKAYLAASDQDAFGELVRRHTPKVLAAAGRVLGDRALAEDAAQATFLLLARRAGSIRRGSSVSGWLTRTAAFIALRAARSRKRRATREEAAVMLRERAPREHDGAWRELAPKLDEAIAGLSPGYRDAVVLRHLDGLSQKETARELGISESAVSLRTMRGLERLREKLAQRGAVFSVAILVLLLGERASACEAAGLASSIQAVCRGTAEVSSSVNSMLEGAMKSIRWTRMKLIAGAAAVLLCLAGVTPVAVNAWAGGEGGGAPIPEAPERPEKPIAAAVPEKKPEPKPKPRPRPGKIAATARQKREVVREANALAFDLYAQLRKDKEQKGKNIFFSPFSISSALAMTYAGAAGNTAAEMRKVLHFDLKEQELHPAFSDLTASFNKRGKDGNYKLALANRLWGQKDYHFLQNFLEMNKLYYGAGIERVNFVKDPDGSRKTINAWVEKKTEDRIQELLKPIHIKPDTRLVLTNAIYFKGDWAAKFNKRRTCKSPFAISAGEKVKVPMMSQTAKFPYAQCDGFEVLELPYKGEELAMLVLLPDRKSNLDALEKKLDGRTLTATLGKIRKQKVSVRLPKFKMTWELDLVKTFKAMGIKDAFVYRRADFSGMDGSRTLFISAIVHKAFVGVDEVGTEAAAATAVVMTKGCAGPKYPCFCADRPFVFVIRDRKTGSILFMGRVTNPEEKS